MKKLRVEDAVGQVLCHDMTRIVKGEMKGPQFRKGHIIRKEDIPMLLSMGKEQIYVWEKLPGMLHEDEAAEALALICRGDNIRQTGPTEGKIEFFAQEEGLFYFDTEKLNAINDITDLVVSTRHALSPVKAGDKLAGMKAVPLVIPEEKLNQAREAAGPVPLMSVLPYRLRSACVITTGSEVAKGLITDTFTPVIIAKLAGYGILVKKHIIVGDGMENVALAITEARAEKADLILCTGGMSVDPDDNTPGAIKQSGAEIITYGVPVTPGVMFLLGYYEDGSPILGVPGCVMYVATTIFDLILPRIAAGLRMTRRDFTRMGNGGLCLACPACHYPICPFGKVS
ncbi:molybdopterin-binding protein [Treponema primitia]|uniref:molybdopterin-binding protein n=1 Tax=Treponema primitia TaxID=88058 RepID=UPI000474FDDB|nr:molybdopterin-binding protein [Treponema primitia]